MLNLLEQELEKREKFYRYLDAAFDTKFNVCPGDTRKRIRRNKVHAALLAPLGVPPGDWRTKRMVGEYLKARGIRFLFSSGNRFFTCLEFKEVLKKVANGK